MYSEFSNSNAKKFKIEYFISKTKQNITVFVPNEYKRININKVQEFI